MFDLKFDAEAFLALYVSVQNLLSDYHEDMNILVYDTLENLRFILEEKLLSALGSECDKS